MEKFKNNKGITLNTLIITVVVISIIAGTAAYTGMDVYKEAKKEVFMQELQIVQNAVNNEASKIEADQRSYGYYLTGLDTDKIDSEAFIEYTPKQIEDKFGISGINQNIRINLITKEVKSVNGISVNGEMKYSLSELNMLNQVVNVDEEEVFKDYVIDGLMLHFDGINNTDNGHSNTHTTWTNLVTGNSSNTITINF